MDNVRLRRLKADHEALRRLAHLHPRIQIEGVFGNPPERYRLSLKVKSLRERNEQIELVTEHRLEVTLPRGYPRDAPLFRMLTPVFHPNIAPHAVCIGDDWSAGESLDHLVQRVGEILAYQSYNTKSPLNGRAAQWVDENRDQLPIDAEEFFIDLSATHEPAADPAVPVCANCGAQGGTLARCGVGHLSCEDCSIRCKTCGGLRCLACGDKDCPVCRAAAAAASVATAATTADAAAAAPAMTVPAVAAATAAPITAPEGAAPVAAMPAAAIKPSCSNCGAQGTLIACHVGHLACGDCAVRCATCANLICLTCGDRTCATCRVAATAPA